MRRERQRDRPGSGSHIEDGCPRRVSQPVERPFDQELGFRSRNQDAGPNDERQTHELSLASQIGHRLAGGTTLNKRQKAIEIGRCELVMEVQNQAGSVEPENVT